MTHKSVSSTHLPEGFGGHPKAGIFPSLYRFAPWLIGIAARLPIPNISERAEVKRESRAGLAMDHNLILQQPVLRTVYGSMNETSRFFRNSAIIFACLLSVSLIAGHFCFDQTFLVDRLLPAPKSVVPWQMQTTSDSEYGGSSVIRVHEATHSIDYSFTASSSVAHSFASIGMFFYSEESALVDLSQYGVIRFNARCSPRNVLSFTVHTFDKKLTVPGDSSSYRIPTAFFACEESWTPIEIDLKHLEIPEWWLYLKNIPLSDRSYDLSQAANFSFGISGQSPKDVHSSVKIADLELIGRDWRFAYVFGFLAGVIWVAYGIWFFKQHGRALVADLQEKMQKDRPLIAYQQLSVEPHKDKEKSAVLRFMATEYANPDISLDTAIHAIGINRAKMNSILKDEIGLTFSAYLNKLRLTEAARLLAEKPEANVAEIAFSVGYNNVSYFNKLFKNEYGCSPKTFKSVYPAKGENDEHEIHTEKTSA